MAFYSDHIWNRYIRKNQANHMSQITMTLYVLRANTFQSTASVGAAYLSLGHIVLSKIFSHCKPAMLALYTEKQ